MILKPEVHHPNDVTIGYLIDVMAEKLHHALGLPGKFVKNYPTRIIKRDGSEREMDWLMLVEPDNETLFEKILINVEFQSSKVDKAKIESLVDYKDYSKTYYGLPVLSVVVITDGYESSEKEYCLVASDIFKPFYIHMSEEEVIEKLNNLEDNIDSLNEDDAIDMVLLPMFASKEQSKIVTEKIVHIFRKNISISGIFRNDIAFALSIMVRKYFDLTEKGKELLKMMHPEVTNNRMRNVIDFEIDYARRAFKKEMQEELEKQLSLKDKENEAKLKQQLSLKDKENERLKAILDEHNISY
ncbi:hypothetical protein [Methanobrevibacter sp.]